MQITGYFIEYLIIGSLTLVWSIPLLIKYYNIIFPENVFLIAIFAPSIYVIGMIVDVIGHYLTNLHRRCIRSSADKKYLKRYKIDKIEHGTIDVDLTAHEPELARASSIRTSRARIARGTLTNSILASVAWLPIIFKNVSQILYIYIIIILLILLIIGLWYIWARWQKIAYRFEIKSYLYIKKKS
jgi:hypothetical protein